MSRLYPQQKSIEVDPLSGTQELIYILEGITEDVTRDDFRLKYAFPAKLAITSRALKDQVRNILVEIIDASGFTVASSAEGVIIAVPIRGVSDESVLPKQGSVRIPVLIKLVKQTSETEPEQEFKCKQEIYLMTGEETEEEPDEEVGDADDYDSEEEVEKDDDAYSDDVDEEEEEEEEDDDASSAGLYSGLIAVDYGTSNSSMSVRDPSFASEEVRGQLSAEQWKALCEWMNIWLSEHLSSIEPNNLDLFVQNLTLVVPNAEIPECGSPKSEITQALIQVDDKMRTQVLSELLSRLSNCVKDGSDAQIMKQLASETMEGFEAVIDSNNLESQRYFVLELDRNVGPAPISSVLQIVSVPGSNDPETLTQETKVDMGARVGLLLHSAAMGDIDIRQFVLSSKRYFGQDETVEVVPAESGGEPIDFPADILAKLTYKELFNRAVEDIHRRSEQGMFQDASWLQTVVATFPTSYPAALRKTVREILGDLDIKEIDTRFDEATAAAIYYIWREIGADPVCGMHGLMARSRKDKYGRAYQNILLYDLGGGTTDIALIQLLYEEVAIFAPEDDRGNGGCYFRITPRLLGTTGHRHLGGDLLTLWVFRLVKAKLADLLLTHISTKNIEPPMDNPLNQLMMNMPDKIVENPEYEESIPQYRTGALLDWAIHPTQFLRDYSYLNEKVIDVLVPTRFIDDRSKVPNFFTLWEITDELKKTLGTPIIEHFGTCLGTGLGNNWPDEMEIDSGQLLSFVQMIQPWLVDGGHIQQDDLRMVITQEEMNNVIADVVSQSISLASSLAQARLISENRHDRVDRLILSGLSCNMKAIQDVAENVFRESEVFIYDPENVRFDRDYAKTAVSLGACIGRYMESVRVDPFNEKTRQLLRDGYDQIELVIENLFSYLPCRLAYDSLVAMVPIFEQGQELNCKSYWDNNIAVARTSIKDLRPVQEKFWIYRIDFPGAEPQYLGLINAESVATDNNFEDFRKFREEYVVGFEADAELGMRAFFLPKGEVLMAKEYCEPTFGEAHPELISPIGSQQPINSKTQFNEQDTEQEDEQQEVVDTPEVDEFADDIEDDAEFADDEFADDVEETENSDELEEEEENEEEEEQAPRKPRSYNQEEKPTHELNRTILIKELLDEEPAIEGGELLKYTIQYSDGQTKKCCVSNSLSLRDKYCFKLFDPNEETPTSSTTPTMQDEDEDAIARYEVDMDDVEEATLACEEDGRMVLLIKCPFEIEISADIEYMAQKLDANYDPFCGVH